jgi:hypothetical protein
MMLLFHIDIEMFAEQDRLALGDDLNQHRKPSFKAELGTRNELGVEFDGHCVVEGGHVFDFFAGHS